MTQEEKQLLIKDLCARLPYGVIMEAYPLENPHKMTIKDLAICQIMTEPYKPYLRPMSSMTEEEQQQLIKITETRIYWVHINQTPDFVDMCNAHHLDYRGLIPMGLALEAPEGMYK